MRTDRVGELADNPIRPVIRKTLGLTLWQQIHMANMRWMSEARPKVDILVPFRTIGNRQSQAGEARVWKSSRRMLTM